MKITHKFLHRPVTAIALLLAVGLTAPLAMAKKKPEPATGDQPARVIAHLPLQGALASQMFLQAEGGRQFLYVDQGSSQGFTVVDVTKPTQPAVVKHVESGKVRVAGSGLALEETPDQQSKTMARSHVPTESVTVLDTSDPANPKTVQTFTGVSSILQDNGRGLVYLTNADGLWVLQHTASRMRPARTKPNCGSEAAIQAMPPDCQ